MACGLFIVISFKGFFKKFHILTLMKKIIPFVWKYLMQQKIWLFLTIISLLLAFVTPLFAPVLYKDLINIAALGLQPGTVEQLYSIAWKFALVVGIMQL